MPFGLPWSEQFAQQISDEADRREFVADQVSVRIALAVRAIREERGLSQAELGELAGTTQSAISRLEDPDSGKPSVTTLLKVAAALDVPLSVTFPDWEDWFREGLRLRRADLRRRTFGGVTQAAQAASDANIAHLFPVTSPGAPTTAATVVADDGLAMKVRMYA